MDTATCLKVALTLKELLQTHQMVMSTEELWRSIQANNLQNIYFESSVIGRIYPLSDIIGEPVSFEKTERGWEIVGADILNAGEPAYLQVLPLFEKIGTVKIHGSEGREWNRTIMSEFRIYVPR